MVNNYRASTERHSKEVEIIGVLLGKALGLDEGQIERIKLTAKYHDTGKMFLPDEIIWKPGVPTKEEFEIIKTHVTISRNILRKNEKNNIYMPDCCKYVLYHHENWDGSGYRRRKGDEIPKIARILRIADSFSALTEERCYKPALSIEETIKIMDTEKHFYDPVIYPIFRDIIIHQHKSSTRSVINL